MPPIASNIILYTSIAAFVLCVIGGLLILFERWEPKHAGTRRWLVGGVLVSIVGGVVGNSNRMFSESVKDATPEHDVVDEIRANAVAPIVRRTGAIEPRPLKPDPEITSKAETTSAESFEPNALDSTLPVNVQRNWSSDILSWQSENLPTRPMLPDPPDKSYPKCADEIKTQDITEITKQSARGCFRLLDRFNSETLLPYQFLYHPYTDQVERAARYQSDSEILDFLQVEYFSLTDSEGADFLRFNEISNKFDGDRRWVQRLK